VIAALLYAIADGTDEAATTTFARLSVMRPSTYSTPSPPSAGLTRSPSPVRPTDVQGSSYTYAYYGLRIPKKTDSKWIFITSDWNPHSCRIVRIADSADTRIDCDEV
jgi:hypothetical protein